MDNFQGLPCPLCENNKLPNTLTENLVCTNSSDTHRFRFINVHRIIRETPNGNTWLYDTNTRVWVPVVAENLLWPICKENLENVTNTRGVLKEDTSHLTLPRKIEINVYSNKVNSEPHPANLYHCKQCNKNIAIEK